MTDREKRRQELLQELARRFRDSADTLKEVARKINTAAQSNKNTNQRLNEVAVQLNEHVKSDNQVESDSARAPFTYLEYLEFSSAEEFQKFKDMNIITDEEIEAIDWEKLSGKLLTE